MSEMKHGDFSALADNYAKYRPGYSPLLRDTVAGLLPVRGRAADIGAGTGIWARMLAEAGLRVWAVEPNQAMRQAGQAQSPPQIEWVEGSAEASNLPAGRFDLVSMASSFHWPDFDRAVSEFHRLLKPGGYFLAIWNTRQIKGSPLLEDIEAKIYELAPGLKRVSSGRSEFCEGLTERLGRSPAFGEVLYLEGFHLELQSPERYLGLWESVNDIRVQVGEEGFRRFLDYVREKTGHLEFVEARYQSRAWLARRAD